MRADEFETPLIELQGIDFGEGNRVFAKCENHNRLSRSHYDRVYRRLFDYLIREKKITPGRTHLIETSSGNAGTSFAAFCDLYGFKGTIVFPKNARQSRLDTINSKHVDVIVSDYDNYMLGAKRTMLEILQKKKCDNIPAYIVNHSQEWVSVEALKLAGDEINAQLPKEVELNYFISALGNGTSTSGIGLSVKEQNPQIKIIGFEPTSAPTVFNLLNDKSCNYDGKDHPLTGTGVWGIDFPNFLTSLLEKVDLVDTDDSAQTKWQEMQSRIQQLTGEYVGLTSAVSVMLASQLGQEVNNKNILVVFYDSGEFY